MGVWEEEDEEDEEDEGDGGGSAHLEIFLN